MTHGKEQPSDRHPAPARDAALRYLELLKRCLTRDIFLDEEVVDVMGWPAGGPLGDPEETWAALRKSGLRIVRPIRDRALREQGADWPPHAETMVGRARLDNVQDLVVKVLEERVPGDLVETGVWRGGVVILMRAVLAAFGDDSRRVWVCDSFQGLPAPDVDRFPVDASLDVDRHMPPGITGQALAVPVERVRRNFERYDLLDDRVRFLEGWFRDTLPDAPIDRIALLRLDGDLYESTMDALVNLEPKVSPGGFVVVDDYNGLEACRAAVEDYRAKASITAEIHEIDWTGVWWRKPL